MWKVSESGKDSICSYGSSRCSKYSSKSSVLQVCLAGCICVPVLDELSIESSTSNLLLIITEVLAVDWYSSRHKGIHSPIKVS